MENKIEKLVKGDASLYIFEKAAPDGWWVVENRFTGVVKGMVRVKIRSLTIEVSPWVVLPNEEEPYRVQESDFESLRAFCGFLKTRLERISDDPKLPSRIGSAVYNGRSLFQLVQSFEEEDLPILLEHPDNVLLDIANNCYVGDIPELFEIPDLNEAADWVYDVAYVRCYPSTLLFYEGVTLESVRV